MIAQVAGSGPKGRITIDDIKAHAKSLLTQPGAPALTGGAIRVPPLPDFTKWGEVERERMNNVRKMTAQHMALCWGTIPHVTQHDKADITDLEKMRKRYAKKAEMSGGKLTLTAMLLKIVASALKVYPQFNASVDLANEELVLKKYINIGVAVDTPKGLVVPVVRDVDKKNIIELSVELTEIAEKSRDGKVSPNDMQGGTFTISNLGGIGGSFFTPIVNHPEVAILGVGRGAYESVYVDHEFVPRLMLPMSLSYDHRVIDGADGARFLRWIADAIQEPLLVAMEG
jgi:pyruvate dehydrogenase E2 component (dihydrolipoamide acetyltransferase)